MEGYYGRIGYRAPRREQWRNNARSPRESAIRTHPYVVAHVIDPIFTAKRPAGCACTEPGAFTPGKAHDETTSALRSAAQTRQSAAMRRERKYSLGGCPCVHCR